jgi:hypothetical protein
MRTMIFGIAMTVGLGTAALAADRPVTPPPAGPQSFLWIEGGYSHLNHAEVHAFDFDPMDVNNAQSLFFDISRGWYGRAEAGFIIPPQRFGWIDAISVAVGYRKGSADMSRRANPGQIHFNLMDPNGVSAGAGVFTNVVGEAHQKFDLLDVQLRLKSALAAWPGFTVNAEPFIGRVNHNAFATIGVVGLNSNRRFASIKGDIYGFQVAIEGQRRLNEKLTLRGRASVGGYRIYADGNFGVSFSDLAPSVSKNFGGVRHSVEIGADFTMAPGILFGVTGGIDHWSKMPSPRLTANPGATFVNVGPPVGINTDSFTDYYVGARLTFFTGVPSNVITTY